MKIISEWKKVPKVVTRNNRPIKNGYKRVMTSHNGITRHIDIKK